AMGVGGWEAHEWGDGAHGMSIVTSVMRVQQLFLARADSVLATWDLTYSRYEVLMTLLVSRVGTLTPSKIGARLQVQPGAVTSAMNLLEGQGMLRRSGDPTDGRVRLATITRKGRDVALAATEKLGDTLFNDLGLSESDTA